MITDKQAQRLLHSAALSAALLLTAAPSVLAQNAPKPEACFLSSPGAFTPFMAPRPASDAAASDTAAPSTASGLGTAAGVGSWPADAAIH